MTNPIQTHFVILCNELNVGNILPYLRAERMVTTEELEILSNTQTPLKQRRERLLIMMPKKGSDFFKHFGNCLVWSGQIRLAKHIGVDVAAVPICPHASSLPGGMSPKSSYDVISGLYSPNTGNLPPGFQSHQPPVNPSFIRGDAHQPGDHPPIHPAPPPKVIPQRPPKGNNYTDNGPPGPPPKVFILYHKDPEAYKLTAVNFADQVLDMARLLYSIGGFELSVDFFHEGEVGNWGLWTETKVKESRFVVLVCSPKFSQALQNPDSDSHRQLDTERGSFFTNAIVNIIQQYPQKFTPVFLFDCVVDHWIPEALRTAPKFVLNMERVVDIVDAEPGSREYSQQINDVLRMREFDDWARLINHLRGEGHVLPPPPPIPPGTIPSDSPPGATLSPKSLITDEEFHQIAQTITTSWRMLGYKLGLPHPDLEAIKLRHPEPIGAAMEMFELYKRDSAATRSALGDALRQLGFGAIADRLFQHGRY